MNFYLPDRNRQLLQKPPQASSREGATACCSALSVQFLVTQYPLSQALKSCFSPHAVLTCSGEDCPVLRCAGRARFLHGTASLGLRDKTRAFLVSPQSQPVSPHLWEELFTPLDLLRHFIRKYPISGACWGSLRMLQWPGGAFSQVGWMETLVCSRAPLGLLLWGLADTCVVPLCHQRSQTSDAAKEGGTGNGYNRAFNYSDTAVQGMDSDPASGL